MSNIETAPRNAVPVNEKRLWDRHMQMAEIGAIEGPGSCRLALTDEDGAARDLLAKWCRSAGLEMRSDRAGNMFAIRSGRNTARGIVAAGSHLDTQPHGGRFDGISGVLAALEAVEALNDAGIETEAGIAVVNWTNEEGVRFAPGLLGSSWFIEKISDEKLDGIVDTDGTVFADELERIGWRGHTRPTDLDLEAFFELHIEQGPVLQNAGAQIGVVTSVQGLRWLDVTVTGMDAHAGTTPFDSRSDSLLAAAAMLVELNNAGRAVGPETRVSVGRLVPATDGPSTIVGETRFVIDIRHPDTAKLDFLEEDCSLRCTRVASEHNCDVEVSKRISVPPCAFEAKLVSSLAEAAEGFGYNFITMASGALHDAANIASVVPSAMVFVPCRDGISHNVKEYAAPGDLAAGTNVLLAALLHAAGVAG